MIRVFNTYPRYSDSLYRLFLIQLELYRDIMASASAGSGTCGSGSGPPLRRTPTDSSFVCINYSPHSRSSQETLTSLQYDFQGIGWDKRDPNSQSWMYASEARAKQAGLAPGVPGGRVVSPSPNSRPNYQLY